MFRVPNLSLEENLETIALWLLNEDSLIHEGNSESPIITVAGNLNIRRERIYVKADPREGLRVPFCLRSLDTQGGTIKSKMPHLKGEVRKPCLR